MKAACEFLRSVDAPIHASLLEHSQYRVISYETTSPFDEPMIGVEVASHPSISKALLAISNNDKERIVRAIADGDPSIPEWAVTANAFVVSDIAESAPPGRVLLLAELLAQKETLIDVATGGARFNDVNDYYKARRRRIEQMGSSFQVLDPSPFADLWDWHRHWCDENWTSYAERRQFINGLYEPVLQGLLIERESPVPKREPTGWERVDRAMVKAHETLNKATQPEDFQAVGLLCRELLISLGQAVFDPDVHPSIDGVEVSTTDAKRMLESFIGFVVPGESNETLRRHAKGSLSLALELQHRRTANFRQAALCLEATSSTMNVVAILAGRRDR